MALDATVGGTASDTYGTLVEADAYWTARQAADWAPTEAAKEYALRKAAQYLDNVYRGRWKGLKVNREQALAWPRSYAIDSDGYSVEADTIPQELKNAQFEVALLYIAGTDPLATVDRAVKSEQVGELSVTYMDSAALVAQYPAVTNWLTDLVNGSTAFMGGVGTGSIVRA
jgi:hypothetical protein